MSKSLTEDLVNAINCSSCIIKWNDGEPYIKSDGQHNEENKKVADLLGVPIVREEYRRLNRPDKPDEVVYDPEEGK